jgi:hypothetical protein
MARVFRMGKVEQYAAFLVAEEVYTALEIITLRFTGGWRKKATHSRGKILKSVAKLNRVLPRHERQSVGLILRQIITKDPSIHRSCLLHLLTM